MANEVTIVVGADTKGAEASFNEMGGKMKTALSRVAKGAAAFTVVAGAAAVLGEESKKASNTIMAGTGATGKQLEGLVKSFENVVKTGPEGFDEVSAAIADVNTEMGLEGEALEEITKAFLDVSRVMGEDASPMIKAVADSMIAMGEPVENTKGFLDELTVASQAVGVPMTTLADQVIKFGPQLSAMGLPLTDAIALIGGMEAKGQDVGKMMPGLNKAIKTLVDEGVTDIAAGLNDAIDSIENTESDTEALGKAMDLFGSGAGLRFHQAIDLGALSVDGLVTSMKASEGKVDEMGKEAATTSEKFDTFKNKVKVAVGPIGDFANAAGPLLIMLPGMTAAFSLLAGTQIFQTAIAWAQTAAMWALNFAMGPIGLIIFGIVAAVTAAILIFKNWDEIVEVLKATWDKVWNAIKSVFDAVVSKVKEIFNSKLGWLLPGGILMKAIEFLKDNWDKIWNGMKETVRMIVNPIIGFVNTIIRGINKMIDGVNTIEVKIPDWVPVIGGKGFKFNIPKIPEIPTLAEGGIVRSPTLAMIGERGPEAVIPLGRGGGSGGTGTTINIQILGPTYGFDDFEDKIGEAITDGIRRGGLSGTLAAA